MNVVGFIDLDVKPKVRLDRCDVCNTILPSSKLHLGVCDACDKLAEDDTSNRLLEGNDEGYWDDLYSEKEDRNPVTVFDGKGHTICQMCGRVKYTSECECEC